MRLSTSALDGCNHRIQHRCMQYDQRLFEESAGRLRLFIAARSSNQADTDDIVQETFLKFYALQQEQEVNSPLGYMYRIALNLMIDRSRRRTPLNSSVDIDDVAESHLSIRPGQEESRRLADLQRAYHAALAELSPRCAEVFHMRRHREMATPDVAANLSITTRMVQKHMVTAMAHLRDRLLPFLSDDYSDTDDGGFSVPMRCQMASSSSAHA
ncbi:RNA polymerase sigma factor [Sphingomonas psychrotolerans]|uniref:RNA polymerase sigma factor n=1 Tax=Sphingomonas psychrotolerans TaxID=1327635 RepID=A0A2K8MJC7_9SPHN|nr:RNA polymerase sigma factor [Sphingomonas psychrotolerans]ATY33977.1 hypothetical protein CVN68_20140 [Sphingomonas psychrotolerans]